MNRKIILPLIFLVIVAVFFRFYRLADFLYFTIDEERDSFIMRKIILEKRPTLIGPAVPRLTYLGPFYFNFSALIFFGLTQDLVLMGGVASLVGVINVILLFYVLKNMQSVKLAFIACLIYSFSFLIAIYNRNYWPLTYTQFAVIGTYYCLDKILKGDRRYIYYLILPLLIGIQSEPTTFSLIPLVLLVLFINKIFEFKKIAILFVMIIFSHMSLVIFDFRHDHMISMMLWNFFNGEHRTSSFNIFGVIFSLMMVFLTFVRTINIFGKPDVSFQIAPIENYFPFRINAIPQFVLVISLIGLMIFAAKSCRSRNLQVVSLHLATVVFGISLYNFFFPGYTFEWFVNCLFPAFCVIWAWLITFFIKNKFAQIVLLTVLFTLNFRDILIGGNSFSIKSKIEAVKWASLHVESKDFELISIGGWLQGGYRFLFSRYGKEPAKSYQDGIFSGWMYAKNSVVPSRHVVFVSEIDFKDKEIIKEYNYYKTRAVFRNKFQNIEVLIY